MIDNKKDIAYFAQATIPAAPPSNHLSHFDSHCLVHRAIVATYKIRMSDKGIRISSDNEPEGHEVSRGVLATLHLTVHDPGIVAFSIDVMHLSLFIRHLPMESKQPRPMYLCHESELDESDKCSQ